MSQASFVSKFRGVGGQSVLNQKRTYAALDGKLIPTNYVIKAFTVEPSIKVKVPQQLISLVNQDKQVLFRYLQFYDQRCETLPNAQIQRIMRILAVNACNNNYDENGEQTNVVGYLTYDISKKLFQSDSQPFEVDAKIPIQVIIQELNRSTGVWSTLDINSSTFPNSFIYYDVEVVFEFND